VHGDGELAPVPVDQFHVGLGLASQFVRHTGGVSPDLSSDRALTDYDLSHDTRSFGPGGWATPLRRADRAPSRSPVGAANVPRTATAEHRPFATKPTLAVTPGLPTRARCEIGRAHV